MSNKTTLEKALIELLKKLEQSAQFYHRRSPLHFIPKTQYILSDWDNHCTKKLNKDTFIVKNNSCLIGGVRLYKGYIAEVVGRDPATGERIFFVRFSGFYYISSGHYNRL